jgi:dTDP-4-amino-4,6-dideoxygalactose transaminase
MIPFVDLIAQYRTIEHEITAAIQQVLQRGVFILGPELEAFEAAFAAFVETNHAVGVSCGLDALRLGLLAVDVGPGDEVIVPANTYIGTAIAVTAVGARPVLVDCDPETYEIDAGAIEARLGSRTRAIIPVHLAGQSADLGPILRLASERGLYVIEDAAQAHGARYSGKPCGSIGTLGCFSFYPSKNLGAYGDAGMIVTNDGGTARRLQRLRHWGEERKNIHAEIGFNARLDTLQAAVLHVKLRHLECWNNARAAHAVEYAERLAGIGDLQFQRRVPASTHVFHLFVVETDHRDALRTHLERHGIETGIHYPIPIHLQQAYAHLGHQRGAFPCAERLAARSL